MEHIKELLPKVSKPLTPSNHSDESVYQCSICQDFGMIHPLGEDGKTDYSRLVACSCSIERLEKERMERMMRYCYLPTDTEDWTFKNFDAYNDSLVEALSAAREIAKVEGDIKWLTLSGAVDCGKSHLAVAICREWLSHDKPARYVFVPGMLDDLRAGYDNNAEYSFENKMRFYKTVHLLVMDDLGTEKMTEWGYEKLCIIINHRSEEGLHLVVTTNKPLDAIPGDREHRIGSRLLRHRQGKIVIIDAPEYRLRRRVSK